MEENKDAMNSEIRHALEAWGFLLSPGETIPAFRLAERIEKHSSNIKAVYVAGKVRAAGGAYKRTHTHISYQTWIQQKSLETPEDTEGYIINLYKVTTGTRVYMVDYCSREGLDALTQAIKQMPLFVPYSHKCNMHITACGHAHHTIDGLKIYKYSGQAEHIEIITIGE